MCAVFVFDFGEVLFSHTLSFTDLDAKRADNVVLCKYMLKLILTVSGIINVERGRKSTEHQYMIDALT